MIEIFAGSSEDTSLSTLFLNEHVIETIALQEIDIGIDGTSKLIHIERYEIIYMVFSQLHIEGFHLLVVSNHESERL